MPGTDGITLLKQLRTQPEYKNLLIIMITGHSCCEVMKELLYHDRVCCIEKPFRVYELVNIASWKMNEDRLNCDKITEDKFSDNKYLAVDKIRRYIREAYPNPHLCPKSIRKRIGISIPRMNRLFKEMMAHTPMEHLDMYRVKRAKDLLRDTDLAVKDIAEQTGYRNLKTFYSHFTKYAGTTPRLYREQYAERSYTPRQPED